MNRYLYAGIGFTAGAGMGALFGYLIGKERYKKKADEEIQSVKDTFTKNSEIKVSMKEEKEEPKTIEKSSIDDDIRLKANAAKEKPDISSILSKEAPSNVIEEKEDYDDGIHVITASEYADEEYEEYRKLTLRYYQNNILVDNHNEVIEDVTNTVGPLSFDQFDSDDILYVRNDRLKIDFDIQKMEEPYV